MVKLFGVVVFVTAWLIISNPSCTVTLLPLAYRKELVNLVSFDASQVVQVGSAICDAALMSHFLSMVSETPKEIIKSWLNGPERSSFRPLLMTSSVPAAQCVEATRYLLDTGASCSITDTAGRSPLHLAIRHNSTEAMHHLLTACGRELIDLPDHTNSTPLMYASFWGRHHMVPALLDAGARVETRDTLGSDAVIIALSNGHINIANLLWHRNQKIINHADAQGRTPLHIFVDDSTRWPQSARRKVVQWLIDKQAKLDMARSDDGQTALMAAAALPPSEDNMAIIKALLDSGADTTVEDRQGRTALRMATNKEVAMEIQRVFEQQSKPLYQRLRERVIG